MSSGWIPRRLILFYLVMRESRGVTGGLIALLNTPIISKLVLWSTSLLLVITVWRFCREIDGNLFAPTLNKLVLFTKHPERSNYPTYESQEVTNPTHAWR